MARIVVTEFMDEAALDLFDALLLRAQGEGQAVLAADDMSGTLTTERFLVAVLTSFLVLFFFFFTLDNSLPLKSSFGFCFP